MRKGYGVLLCLAALALSGPAAAMYRCGNVFQDRPCDAGVPEQRIYPGGVRGSTGGGGAASNAPAAGTAQSRFAAACGRVGEHAQRISWKREAGATLERQINESGNDPGMVKLIQAVYARRGSTPDIRAAIEAECVAERTEQEAAAQALRTLQKQAGQTTMGPSDGPAPAPAAARTVQAAPAAAPAARPGPDPRCGSLKSDRAYAESRLREGGDVRTMEQWQNRRREVEKEMAEARC